MFFECAVILLSCFGISSDRFIYFLIFRRFCTAICYRLVKNTQLGPCGNGALKTERVPFQKDIYCEIEFFSLISFWFLLHFLFVRFVIAHSVYSKCSSKINTQENWCKRIRNDKMCSVASNFGWFDLEISSNTRTNHITLFLFYCFFLFIIQVNSGFFIFHLEFFIAKVCVAMHCIRKHRETIY